MSTVEEIERAVEQLSSVDLEQFRDWFAEFQARLWDERIERDIAVGKLDALAEEALADLAAGRCKEL